MIIKTEHMDPGDSEEQAKNLTESQIVSSAPPCHAALLEQDRRPHRHWGWNSNLTLSSSDATYSNPKSAGRVGPGLLGTVDLPGFREGCFCLRFQGNRPETHGAS